MMPARSELRCKKVGLRAARQLADRAFHDPSLGNQLLGNGGNGAALHARAPGHGGAGNRLVAAHQIEHNAAIDIAGRFATGDLDIVQIKSAQPCFHTICSIYELIHLSSFVQHELAARRRNSVFGRVGEPSQSIMNDPGVGRSAPKCCGFCDGWILRNSFADNGCYVVTVALHN